MHENRNHDRKSPLVDEIRELNPSVGIGFLAEFSVPELELYRERLRMAAGSPKSIPWIRRNDVWPVATLDCA